MAESAECTEDCYEDMLPCVECSEPLCSIHDDPINCERLNEPLHNDCNSEHLSHCGDCREAARYDAAANLADAIRKGEW